MRFIGGIDDALPFLVAALVGAGVVAFLLTPIVRRVALRLDVVDRPDPRRVNRSPVPRGGGIAVVVAFVPVALVLVALNDRLDVLPVPASVDGPRLIALLLYGSGLRISEACALRVKDVDFDRREILVRQGKGGRDRLTVLPALLDEALRAQIERVRAWHLREVAVGRGHVMLPGAFHRKVPAAVRDWRWQWVFPARRGYHDPATQRYVRHHVHETVVQRAVADAVRRAGLTKRATSHTFRHSFATHVLEAGYDVRTVQELMGHKDLSTTMIYLHVLNRGGRGVRSPVDALVGAAPGPEGSPAVPLDSTGARLTSPASLSRGRVVDGRLVKTSWRRDLRR